MLAVVAPAAAPLPDHMSEDLADKRWPAVLAIWWGLTWRMVVVGGLLTTAATAVFGTGAMPVVSFPVGLLVSLWAVWQLLRERWPVVLAAWWALLWRTALVGGALFAAASWALGTAYRSDAEYLLALAFVLPTSVWAAWGIVCVVERRMVDPS